MLMKKNAFINILFITPILISFVFLKIYKIDFDRKIFIDFFLIAIFFIIIYQAIKNALIKTIFQSLLFLIFSASIFFESIYTYLYKDVISMSSIYVILETNTTEATEYLALYYDTNIFIFTVIIFSLYLFAQTTFILKYISSKKKKENSISIPYKKSIIAIIALPLIMYISGIYKNNFFYIVVTSYNSYLDEISAFSALGNQKTRGQFLNVKHNSNEQELYIVVIGESANRNHMSLYGYDRNTSPNLKTIKNELYVFTDVISPHSNTIRSLGKILTLGNYEHPDLRFKGSILQLFNKAGFETYWLSNQSPLSIFSTQVSMLSRAADKTYFINTLSNNTLALYDEQLFPILNMILKQKKQKKIIFIHLLGNHSIYSKRYPPKFDVFSNNKTNKNVSKQAYKIINEYDNAMLYNDYILKGIIDTIRKTNIKSFVLYFSDHGEDVYDKMNNFGHAESFRTKPMFEIPFILWTSPDFLKNKSFVFDTNRKYMLDDVIYSIADIADIKFNEFEAERSIFNNSFKVRKRLVVDSIDYEKMK